MKKTSAIERAVKILGGPVKTAEAVGVRYQSVAKWRKSGVVTDLLLAAKVARASNIALEEFVRDYEER